jgi:hypothetical protein
MDNHVSELTLEDCRKHCLACHHICLDMAMRHCLQSGVKYTEPVHFRLMLNCAEMCQTNANFILSSSELLMLTCGVCAEICRRCAASCEALGEMDACVEACRSCADSCERMVALDALSKAVV